MMSIMKDIIENSNKVKDSALNIVNALSVYEEPGILNNDDHDALPDWVIKQIEDVISDAAFRLERIKAGARRLKIKSETYENDAIIDEKNGYVFTVNGNKMEEKLTNSYMEKTKNGFHLKLPALPATYNHGHIIGKRIGNDVRDLARILCEKYSENIENLLPEIEFCTLVFIHHYDKFDEEKDTDNLPIKKIIDGLGWLIIKNDSLKNVHILNFSKQDKESFTEVFVVQGHEYYDDFIDSIK